MPTTDDRGDLKLVPGEYEVNASREAFTMVPGAIMDYMPGMLMAYGTYCMQSDANGKILSGAAQDYGRVTVGYEKRRLSYRHCADQRRGVSPCAELTTVLFP